MTEVVVFDADNTLWNTNSVFHDAQVAMLSVLATEGMFDDPDERVDELREVDRRLMEAMGRNEYDFRALAEALIYVYRDGAGVEQAVEKVRTKHRRGENYSSLAERAFDQFSRALERVPPLFPDVLDTLRGMNEQDHVITVLFSEGDEERIHRILDDHDGIADSYFDIISIIHKKVPAAFADLRAEVSANLSHPADIYLMVGDSISSDIRPANEAGFISVYKPGDFMKHEEPDEPIDQPDFVIETIADVPGVLREIRQMEGDIGSRAVDVANTN